MNTRKKQAIKMAPGFLIVALLIISGTLKIWGYHPMRLHFVELGIDDYLPLLGTAEILFSLLFLFEPTSKLGLLLLTAYFGGAMAIEIPYHMMAGPMVPLALIWLSAFLRDPMLFMKNKSSRAVS
jgi:hypothetical protein